MFVLWNTWFVFWQARSQRATWRLSYRRAEQKTPASDGTSRVNCDAQMWTEQRNTCRDSAAGTGCSRSTSSTGIWSCLSAWHLLCPVFFLTAVFFSSRFAVLCMLRRHFSLLCISARCGKGAFLSVAALRREPGERAALLGTLRGS